MASTAFGQEHYAAVAGPASLAGPAKALLEKDGSLPVRIVRESATAPTPAMLAAWHVGSLLELSRVGDRLRVIVYTLDPSAVQPSAVRYALLPLDVSLATHRSPIQLRTELRFPVAVRSVTNFETPRSLRAHTKPHTSCSFSSTC